MRLAVRPAIESDVEAIAAHARPADVAEMEALGTTPERAMREGLALSDWAMTGVLDGVPVCMAGVACHSVLGGVGRPWMLASSQLESAQVAFIRECRPMLASMRDSYPRLLNVVDTRNTTAMRWLRWLGFRFDLGVVPVNGHDFAIFRSGVW